MTNMKNVVSLYLWCGHWVLAVNQVWFDWGGFYEMIQLFCSVS